MHSPILRRRLLALFATIAVHLALVVLLYLLVLEHRKPLAKTEELVLIDLGNVAQAEGSEEPMGQQNEEQGDTPLPPPSEPVVAPKPKPTAKPQASESKPTSQAPEAINTQRHEESLRLKQIAETKAKEAEEARKKQEAELRRKQEAEARREQELREQSEKKRAAGNSVAQAFGAGRGKNTSQGNGQGSGNQGVTEGVSGGSFSLEGRRIVSNGGRLTPPVVNKAIEGRIVVRITVDHNGVVTSASVSPRGTTIADASVRQEALRAARTTSFNPQEGATSQTGTITYIYVLKQ